MYAAAMTKTLVLALTLFSANALAAGNLKLTSSLLKPGATMTEAQVFNGFGCTGSNISPDLQWTAGPEGTKAYAVTMYDPDAPTGSGWWHWLVFNIPASQTSLEAGVGSPGKAALPTNAIESRTDFGKAGYGGPCPPQGDKPHRYIFKVYALKDIIPLDKDAPGAMVGYYVEQLKLAVGQLEVKYGRARGLEGT